jgi:hypothetical protein
LWHIRKNTIYIITVVVPCLIVRLIFLDAQTILMSDSTENLDKAQKNQKRVGAAESDPETTGPVDNVREDAAEAVNEEEDSAEPA